MPQFDPDQYPQDKIDFTLKDLKSYTYRLVSEELGLGELIESYIQKLEAAEDNAPSLHDGLATSKEEEEKNELSHGELEEVFTSNMIETSVENEAEKLLQMIESGEIE